MEEKNSTMFFIIAWILGTLFETIVEHDCQATNQIGSDISKFVSWWWYVGSIIKVELCWCGQTLVPYMNPLWGVSTTLYVFIVEFTSPIPWGAQVHFFIVKFTRPNNQTARPILNRVIFYHHKALEFTNFTQKVLLIAYSWVICLLARVLF